jgi:hypothetical protein
MSGARRNNWTLGIVSVSGRGQGMIDGLALEGAA